MNLLAVTLLFLSAVAGRVVPEVTSVSPEAMKLKQLISSIPLAEEVLDLISSRYEYETPLGRTFLLMHSSLSEENFSHLKHTLAVKMLEKEQSSYVMVFGGSSVTAGHDNLFQDSYPQVVQKTLGPLLAQVGVPLEVRNIAQGANPCLPSGVCYPAMGGTEEERADLYSWEQSMNCGRQNEYPELVMRLAAQSGGVYYHASSGGAQIQCGSKSKDHPPYSSPNFTGRGRRQDQAGQRDAVVRRWKEDLFRMDKDAGGSAAVPVALVKQYSDHMAIGGFAKHDKVFPSSVCAGLELETCSVAAIYASCRLKFLTQEASMYSGASGRGAAWHPSRALHLLRGEAIAWQYALATLDALLLVTADPRLGTRQMWTAMIADFKTKLKPKSHRHSLPAPVFCGKAPLYCHLTPVCYTDFGPHYSPALHLSQLVLQSAKRNRWQNTAQVVSNGQPDRQKHQLETRPRFQTTQGSSGGELFLQVNSSASGPPTAVLVCWGGWVPQRLREVSYYSHVHFTLDLHAGQNNGGSGVYTSSRSRVSWEGPDKKELKHKNCAALHGIPPGSHVLGMESRLDGTAIALSHVIMWEGSDHRDWV